MLVPERRLGNAGGVHDLVPDNMGVDAQARRGDRQMKGVDWDFVMGIPLSVTGKSIFFDR